MNFGPIIFLNNSKFIQRKFTYNINSLKMNNKQAKLHMSLQFSNSLKKKFRGFIWF